MTIFHSLKYSSINIRDNLSTSNLPTGILFKWRRRIEDYAYETWKMHYTVDEKDVNATFNDIDKFRCGKISRQGMLNRSCNVIYTMCLALDMNSVMYYVEVMLLRFTDILGHEISDKCTELFTKWLNEELLAYEGST